MNLKINYEKKDGFTPIVDGGNGIIRNITLGIVSLKKDGVYKGLFSASETGLVILSGKCDVKAGEEVFAGIGERENVFAGRAYAVYVSPGMGFEIKAVTDCEIAVCGAPAEKKGKIRLITPGENKQKTVGKGNWQRDVYNIIDDSVDADKLLIGETINPPGNWSSAPPHRHEEDNLPEESKLDEVYFYKFNPDKGFGIQKVYTDDNSIDETYTIKNNDTVIIPRGYHPVVAGPGYELYYLWILAGDKRVMKVKDDPVHAWLKNT